MKAQKVVIISSKVFIGFSIFSIAYVSILSLFDPVATMKLVNTTLTNTDAISSIRGVYGGVGLAITISLVYSLIKDYKKGLSFLILFWGGYAISRVITQLVDGPLGDFGNQWLLIESMFSVVALGLFLANRKYGYQEFHQPAD